MWGGGNVYQILFGKTVGQWLLGRLGRRWKYIKMGIGDIGCGLN